MSRLRALGLLGTWALACAGCYQAPGIPCDPTTGACADPDGGGGGPDAAPPAGCGGTSLLHDDFQAVTPSPAWYVGEKGSASAAFDGATLTLTAGRSADEYAFVTTRRRYDLRGDALTVHALAVVNDTPYTECLFRALGEAWNVDSVAFHYQEGRLYFVVFEDGAEEQPRVSIPYDRMQPRFWRLEGRGDRIEFQTSATGAEGSFVTHHAAARRDWMQFAQIGLEAGRFGGSYVQNPGAAVFDDLNGGAPGGVWCKASSLTDDFDDGVIGAAWLRTFGGTCMPDESSHEARFAIGGADQCAYVSSAAYDLAGSSIGLEAVAVPATGTTAYLAAFADDTHYLRFAVVDGQARANVIEGAVMRELGPRPYPAAARFWRISAGAGGDLVFATRAASGSWAPLFEDTTTLDLRAVDVELGAAAESGAPAATVRFDRYNLTPP